MSATATQKHQMESNFFKPRRLGHVNMFVDGYDQAARFYTDVAGFEEVYRQPDNMASFLSNGNTYHDFALLDVRCRHAAKDQKPELFHIAFELATEVELVDGYRRALDAGVKFDATMDHDVAHSVYSTDPDGNIVEIYADVIQDWRPVKHGVIVKGKPQWVPGVTTEPIAEPRHPDNPEIRVVETSVFRGRRVTHVAFITRDYEGMFDYYTGYAGLSAYVGGRNSAFSTLRGSASDGDITLLRNPSSLPTGLHHVGIEVASESDLDRALGMLPRKDVKVEKEVDHPARRAIHVLSPDGIRLQFFVNRRWEPAVLLTVTPEQARYLF